LNPFGLVIALKTKIDDSYSYAAGNLYWDNSIDTKKYNLFDFKAK
jgi:hypothetical protein